VASSAAERAWSVAVPHHPRGAGEARTRVAAELRPIVRPELLADAVAVVAELVGNAIRHAAPLPGGVVQVTWRVRYAAGTQIVEVWVTDGGGTGEPRLRHASADAPDGRGLAIVTALADRWGIDRDGPGQSVWAELRALASVGTAPVSRPVMGGWETPPDGRPRSPRRHVPGGRTPTVELPVR
jgi:anti-sigma regulatory factor (Ser/Thr protein kinase)